jgi:dinuclear metal center YbgI/SA1388 family protein
MNLREITAALEAIAPLEHAEPWDNVGLLCGDRESDVDGVLLAIDATLAVVEEATRLKCGLIVAYHPPIFEGLKRVVAGHPAYEAARSGVAIYSPHTALDVAIGGTNDVLADAVGMTARTPLRTTARARERGTSEGIGRIGSIERIERRSVVERLKRAVGVDATLVAGPLDALAERVAVCAGAGGDLLGAAIAERADIFITGELRHHDALRAAASGVMVIALRHSASERCALPALGGRISAALPGLRVTISEVDRDPFVFV